MFGKASIILVIGFSMIFLVYQQNLINSQTGSVVTYSDYYTKIAARDLAVAAANLACNQFFIDPEWESNYANTSFRGGTITITVEDISSTKRQILAVSRLGGNRDTIAILLSTSNFGRFAYYAAIAPGNIYYVTGDTVWGPMHVQGTLNVNGSPVFMGKVTSSKGIKYGSNTSTPIFNGGYEGGVNLTIPDDLNDVYAAAAASGKVFSGYTDVWLSFLPNGTVNYKTSSAAAWTNTDISTLTSNGVIAVDKGNLHIQGQVKGRVTVYAGASSGGGSGNIYIDDDITYVGNPLDPSCTDMLGIVASNNVYIADKPETKGDVTIHGSIFNFGGGISAENLNSLGKQGAIRIVGGLIQRQGQLVNIYNENDNVILKGYSLNIRYDNRMLLNTPPEFPATGSYEIISWRE
ncbi:MAG: hypothetical protein IT279_13910 [Ignavibacteriaceae bacterium]|nr:hypothetical protein [Ignavibacteriaceae bacterium]